MTTSGQNSVADLYSKDAQTLLLSLGLYVRSPKQVTAENKIK